MSDAKTKSARQPTPVSDKLGYVDAMRGIAILMVIVVHQVPVGGMSPLIMYASKYGQMGVQLFFVASAYTLCISHVRRVGEPAPLASFYIRRYFRIAPLYYLAIPLYGFTQFARYYFTVHYAPADLNLQAIDQSGNYSLSNIVANLTFIHGFVPAANNVVVPGGWSIGTEMAFYLIFPALFHVLTRQGSISRVLGIWAGVFIANLCVNAALQNFLGIPIGKNTFVYCNLLNQLPVFIGGAFAFFWLFSKNAAITPLSIARDIFLFCTFTAISFALWDSDYDLAFSIIPATSGCSFIFLINIIRAIPLDLTALRKVGQVSFSMYIFHFLFAETMAKLAIKLLGNVSHPNLVYIAMLTATILCTYAIATVSKHLIEDPGIDFGKKMISRLRRHITHRAEQAAT